MRWRHNAIPPPLHLCVIYCLESTDVPVLPSFHMRPSPEAFLGDMMLVVRQVSNNVYREDGCYSFLVNVTAYVQHYTMSHLPRRNLHINLLENLKFPDLKLNFVIIDF